MTKEPMNQPTTQTDRAEKIKKITREIMLEQDPGSDNCDCKICLGNIELIQAKLEDLFTEAHEAGAREERERIIDLVTQIKNMSGDGPQPWFDALRCVRESIKALEEKP